MNLKDCYLKFGGDFDEVLADCVGNRPSGNLYLNSWTIKASAYLKRLW